MEERNPSPPREFEDEVEKFRQDMIGDTTISKRWVYSILMDMCKEIKKQPNDEKVDTGTADISDDLQDEMCRLWDLCAEEDVACFLADSDYIPLLCCVVEESENQRLAEITVGILGNMACSPKVCTKMCKDVKLLSIITSLLSCRDSPTLIEVGRLINTCLGHRDSKEIWITALEVSLPNFIDDIKFILSSSCNKTVLQNILEMIDICMDSRDAILNLCVEKDFADSVAESGLQLIKDEESFVGVITCLHVLYLLTTVDERATNLFHSNSKIFDITAECCETWIKYEDFNIAEDNPSVIPLASCFSVLSFLLDVSSDSACNQSFMDSITKSQKENVCDLSQLVLKYCETVMKSIKLGNSTPDDEANTLVSNANGEGTLEISKTTESAAGDHETDKNATNGTGDESGLFHSVPLPNIARDLINILMKLKWME